MTTRDVDTIKTDLAELGRLKAFLNHQERELTAELWRAMEELNE